MANGIGIRIRADAGIGQHPDFSQVTSENLFQFTQRGEYWVDVGFFAEYGISTLKGDPNEITLGPVLRKDFWGLSNTINLFFEKDIGHNGPPGPSSFGPGRRGLMH